MGSSEAYGKQGERLPSSAYSFIQFHVGKKLYALNLGWLGSFLPADAFVLRRRLFLRHELPGFVVSLRPGLFAHGLGA